MWPMMAHRELRTGCPRPWCPICVGVVTPKPKRMVPFPRGVRDSRKRISEGNLSEVSLVGVCAWAGRVYMSEDHDI